MQIEFKGKVALVTGAAGAIGKSIAKELKESGAEVFITDLKSEAVQSVAGELGCKGLAANVTSEEQAKAVVDATNKRIWLCRYFGQCSRHYRHYSGGRYYRSGLGPDVRSKL